MSDTYLIPQFIIDYLQKSRSTKSPQKLASKLIQKNTTPEISKWLQDNEVTAGYLWKYFVYYGLTEFSFRECPVCGNRLKLNTILTKPDAKYCSVKCQSLSKEVQEKRKATNQEKYGADYNLNSKGFVEHAKQIKKERYGDENYNNRQKSIQTCLEKYGVENTFQAEKFKEKAKETRIKKYGVEYSGQIKESKEKRKETNLLRYGAKTYSQSDFYREGNRNLFYDSLVTHLKDKKIAVLQNKEEYSKSVYGKFKCLRCNSVWDSTENNYQHIFCKKCQKLPYSLKEKSVVEFIKSIYDGEVLENDKTALAEENAKGNQKELDIYLPQLNLGIEFNGDYWHSLEEVKQRDAEKKTLCEQKGITLLRIQESEWDNNPEIVKQRLRYAVISNIE